MSATILLAQEIAQLQKIQLGLVAISGRSDDARKMDLVNLRRQLATQIGAVSNAAENGVLVNADDILAREFRNLLSSMRRAIALHQANFPAVKLDEAGSEYQLSVRSVREANARFIQWAEFNLKHL